MDEKTPQLGTYAILVPVAVWSILGVAGASSAFIFGFVQHLGFGLTTLVDSRLVMNSLQTTTFFLVFIAAFIKLFRAFSDVSQRRWALTVIGMKDVERAPPWYLDPLRRDFGAFKASTTWIDKALRIARVIGIFIVLVALSGALSIYFLSRFLALASALRFYLFLFAITLLTVWIMAERVNLPNDPSGDFSTRVGSITRVLSSPTRYLEFFRLVPFAVAFIIICSYLLSSASSSRWPKLRHTAF